MNLTPKRRQQPVDVRSGLAFALTFFVIPLVLFFLPRYFGSWTTWVSSGFIVAGFMFLGIELNRLSLEWHKVATDPKDGKDIFDNIGIGAGLFLFWIVIYYNFPYIWLNIIMFFFCFMGTSFILVGSMNLIFDIIITKKAFEDHQIAIEENGEKREALTKLNSSKYFTAIKNIIISISALVGFFASLLTVLQILKAIQ